MQRHPTITQLFDHAWPIVFQHAIGTGEKLFEDRSAIFGFQIQRDGFLAAIDRREIGALAFLERWESAGVVAFARALDLDHACAQIQEGHGAEWPGQNMGQIED